MTDLTKWLMGGGFATLAAMMAMLLRIAHKLGGDAREIRAGLDRITKIEERIERVPLHDVRIGQLEKVAERIASDIRELLRRPRASSQPNIHTDGEE